jgi:hypothetical protein
MVRWFKCKVSRRASRTDHAPAGAAGITILLHCPRHAGFIGRLVRALRHMAQHVDSCRRMNVR